MALAATKSRATTSVSHQKRVGAHQKQTKPFMKTYYPYLPLFGIAGIAVIVVASRVLGTTGAVMGIVSFAIAGASIIL
jgi:hypothetical protein